MPVTQNSVLTYSPACALRETDGNEAGDRDQVPVSIGNAVDV